MSTSASVADFLVGALLDAIMKSVDTGSVIDAISSSS